MRWLKNSLFSSLLQDVPFYFKTLFVQTFSELRFFAFRHQKIENENQRQKTAVNR